MEDNSEKSVILAEQVETENNDEQGLIGFRDVTKVAILSQQQTKLEAPLFYPLGDFTPKQLLERAHKLETFDWTTANVSKEYRFPSTAVMAFYADVLKPFAFLRSGIKFTLRYNSTPYHQGSLIMGWVPTETPATALTYNKYHVSMMNPVILSASQQSEIDYECPYRDPKPSFLVKTTYTTADVSVCNFYIRTLTPLRMASGVTDTLKVDVYVSLLNPLAYGYKDQAQSATYKLEEERKKKIPDVGMKTLVQEASAIVRSIPYVGQIYGPVADMLNETTLSKPNLLAAPNYMSPRWAPYATNCDSVFMGQPVCPQVAAKINRYGYPGHSSRMSVTQMAMVPGLNALESFVAVGNSVEIPTNPAFWAASEPGTEDTRDYLSLVTQIHRYWRGSTRLAIYFACNSFTSARFQLTFANSGLGTINSGSLIQQVLDVKGDTWHYVTLPYIANDYWQEVNENEINYSTASLILTLTKLATINTAATTTIDVAIFRAAGPDFQVALPGEMKVLDDVPQSSLTDLFENKTFEPFQVNCRDACGEPHKPQIAVEFGRCNPEKTYRVIDECRIPIARVNGVDDLPQPPRCTSAFGVTRNPFRVLASCFAFWRGTIRYAHLTPMWWPLRSDTGNYGQGPCVGYTELTLTASDLQLEIPYYEKNPYLVTQAHSNGTSNTTNNTLPTVNDGMRGVLSAGDDFEMLHLIPPRIPALVLPGDRKSVV